MKIAILSDAHGNKAYFQKCVEYLETFEIDELFFLGDCFGYMRDGNYILDELLAMGAHILMGNHEAMLLGILQYDARKESVYGISYDRASISEKNHAYIKTLKSELAIDLCGKKILFAHGRPEDTLTGYLYCDDKSYGWNDKQYDFVFLGHTHYPYIKKVGKTVYANAGSCGLPRDNGRMPSFLIFDFEMDAISLHRILLDEKVIKSICRQNVHPEVISCLMRERNIE